MGRSIINLNILKQKNGFSYIELILGVAILMIFIGGFITLFRGARDNSVQAKELLAMSAVAQNACEVYKSTTGTLADANDAVITEAWQEGFPSSKIILIVDPNADPNQYFDKVTIQVLPRFTRPIIDNYYLIFYVLKKQYYY